MRLLIVLLIMLALDVYVFQGMRALTAGREASTQRLVSVLFWSISLVSFAAVLSVGLTDWERWPRVVSTYLFAFVVILYLSKVFVVAFLIADDVLRVIRWTALQIYHLFAGRNGTEAPAGGQGISRLQFLVRLGFIVGAVPFVSMIYGMIKGPSKLVIRRHSRRFPGLPEAFHGFRVVQVSDLHLGSFFDEGPVRAAVERILDLKPDLILFTGDLVNNLCSEAEPYAALLRRLQAPYGVYSVLGNHDYGEYHRWSSAQEKAENLERLKQFQRDLGWKLLLNEHAAIEKNGSFIGMIGVENWSRRMNFQRYGDLRKATAGMPSFPFQILMTHDPSHWKAEVVPGYPQVDLTLSGHTHGMQFGVEVPGFRWSPVQYVYKEWADWYEDGNQHLYVNRGLGFIGYPGRVGIEPEVTLIVLEKA